MTTSPASPTSTYEKIRIRLLETSGGPAGETLWAEMVEGHEGAGTYRLHNTAFQCGLLVGDLVRCEVDGASMMQVVGVVEAVAATQVCCVVVGSAGDQDAAVRALVTTWERLGASAVEGAGGGFLVATWPDPDAGRVHDLLLQSLREVGLDLLDPSTAHATDRGAIVEVHGPATRVAGLAAEIDFTVDLDDPVLTTGSTYWAGEDPFWAAHGLDDPDLLAQVQLLVSTEPHVASALEDGRHDHVLDVLRQLGVLSGP